MADKGVPAGWCNASAVLLSGATVALAEIVVPVAVGVCASGVWVIVAAIVVAEGWANGAPAPGWFHWVRPTTSTSTSAIAAMGRQKTYCRAIVLRRGGSGINCRRRAGAASPALIRVARTSCTKARSSCTAARQRGQAARCCSTCRRSDKDRRSST